MSVIDVKKIINGCTAEEIAALQEQISFELEVAAEIQDRLDKLMETLTAWEEYFYTGYRAIGKEEEQAKNSNGELLYYTDIAYGTYTEATLAERLSLTPDSAVVFPYYRDIYEQYRKTDEDMSDYDKPRLEAVKRIREYLQHMIK